MGKDKMSTTIQHGLPSAKEVEIRNGNTFVSGNTFTATNNFIVDNDGFLRQATVEQPIKPCPFCGGKRTSVIESPLPLGSIALRVQCSKCGSRSAHIICHPGTDRNIVTQQAYAYWNRRTNCNEP